LRSLFVMRVAAIDYRLRLPGFEVPAEDLRAQTLSDENAARTLEELATELETGKPRPAHPPSAATTAPAETVDPAHAPLIARTETLLNEIAEQLDGDVIRQTADLL